MLFNRGQDSLPIRTNDLVDLLSILEEHERRHSPHAQFLRHIWHLIHIDLVEVDLVLELVGVGHLDDFGGDDFAGAAPGGEAVEDDQLVGRALDDRGRVGGFAADRVNTSPSSCGLGSGSGMVAGSLISQLGLMVGYVLC